MSDKNDLVEVQLPPENPVDDGIVVPVTSENLEEDSNVQSN